MLNNEIDANVFSDFMTPFFSPGFKLSKQGRCSGGVVVLVKKYLQDYIVNLNTECPNCIILKLKNMLYKDLICVFPYIPCSTSPFYNGFENRNGINILESYLYDIYIDNNDCNFLILGDLNSRISNIQPIHECLTATKYLDDVNSSSFFNDDDASFTRQSKDTVLNSFGKSLIELCASLNLLVLNGLSDNDKDGNFTFISPNGNSVIDYCICSEDLLSHDLFLDIVPQVDSWHLPLTFEIQFLYHFSHSVSQPVLDLPYCKHKWLVDNVDHFDSDWNSRECKININNLNDIVNHNNEFVGDCLTAFTELAVYSSRMMIKNVTKNKCFKVKNTWYDYECTINKRKVRKSLRKYQMSNLSRDKVDYVILRNKYKSFVKSKKRKFSVDKTTMLLNSVNNSKVFWNHINNICPRKTVQNKISINKWYDHFKNIFQQKVTTPPILSEPSLESRDVDAQSVIDLNAQMCLSELSRAITKCKHDKAPGPDKLLNEFFKHTQSDCSVLILSIFNALFKNHCFPIEWSHASIVPIFKKGDINSCDNYRPIWLTSLFSKLFTSIINKRIVDFTLKNNIIPEEQAGFREGYSTVDHIFSLYSMIMLQFSKNRKLYVCFVDYRKAFDSVNRSALFKVLSSLGFKGDVLQTIISVYNKVSASVFVDGCQSDEFECFTGLKQGCLLSPNLFTLFMTEITEALNLNGINGIKFCEHYNTIFHLLFADDIFLVSESIEGLQNQLNVLQFQSNRLGLEINKEKTQIVIFRKGGFIAKKEKWFYDKTELNIVNSYRYLGIDFTTKLSFSNAIRPFTVKAKKVCYDISRSLNDIGCHSLDVFSKLFDSKVMPILTYGCELWGLNDFIEVERVHTTCFKRFLNVSTHCANITLYADTGRLPLSITTKIRCVKYWLRLMRLSDSRICKQAYVSLMLLSEQGSKNWVSDIKVLLETNGFGIVWLFKGVGSEILFIKAFKQRLIDCYKQSWHDKLSSSEHFKTFLSFKSIIMKESFLSDINFNKSLRNVVVRFRLGVSRLNCHRYRFYSNKNLLKCPVCKANEENEFHVLFECFAYEDLRCKLPTSIVSSKTNRSMITLLSSSEYYLCLAKFLLDMFERRNDYV